LSAYARAADDRERALLKPYASHIPADILDGTWRLPVSDASGRDRATLRSALTLLAQAGYDLDGNVLRQRATKAPFTFEILVTTRDQERIALAFQRDLKRAGIEATVRAVDGVQFDQRRLGFDFDMIQNRLDQSLSLLGKRGRGQSGHPQLHGRKGSGDRRHDRGVAGGARAPGIRLRGTRARSHPHVRLLCNSPVQRAGTMDRTLESDRTASEHRAIRLSAGNLVAKAATVPEVML
jgi:hypothetical protein